MGKTRNKKIFTFSYSGPKSITGFKASVLAGLRAKTPSLEVYRSDCKDT